MPVINVKPNADGSPLQWTRVPSSVFDFTAVCNGTNAGGGTPDDTTYVNTQTANDVEEFGFGSIPIAATLVTQLAVNVRGWIDDADSETDSYIKLELFHSSGTPVSGNPKTVTSTDFGGQRTKAEVTKTWTGLSLTKTQADSIELQMTLVDPA